MKSTIVLWALIAIVAFFTAGFFPAFILTGLAIASSTTMGLHAHELGSGSSYKSLR